MAKFLVFNTVTKLDIMAQIEIDERITRDRNFQKKYNARSQLGDIVEARRPGKGLCGKEPQIFALVDVPEIPFEDAWDYVDHRYEEVVLDRDVPKEVYTERHTIGIFKYDPTIIKEYKKLTNIPELGNININIDWITLSGIVDKVDRYQKFYLDMSKISLDDKKETTLTKTQFLSFLSEK